MQEMKEEAAFKMEPWKWKKSGNKVEMEGKCILGPVEQHKDIEAEESEEFKE